MKKANFLFLFVSFMCLFMIEQVQAQEPVTIQIGYGTNQNECIPIFNWWKDSYTGNEVIYLRDELGMKKGDKIVALSYYCISGSGSGGNFNVRIINTDLNTLPTEQESAYDVSVLQVGYNDNVYCNATMGSYSAGDWITFTFDEPFVYEGENIIIDIRNTSPAPSQGWCYFACTKDTNGIARRDIVWRNANSEDVANDGFHSGSDPFGNYDSGIYGFEEGQETFCPNTRIKYIPAPDTPMAEDGDYIFCQHSYIVDAKTSSQLPVELFNRNNIKAFEFDIVAPEDILFLNTGTETCERSGDASLSVSSTDNNLHIEMIFNDELSVGKGPICQLGIYATKDGVYSLELLNPIITTTDGMKYRIEDSELQFVSKGMKGDMNGDGNITAADITALYNILLEN